MKKWAIVIGALLLMVGPSAYFVIRKRLAAESVESFLGSGFRERATAPVAEVPVPRGGSFGHVRAWDGRLPNGRAVVVLLGLWSRGTVSVRNGATPIYNRVAGVYLAPAPDAAWLARRHGPDVLIASPVDNGAIIVWEGLPTGTSLRQHLEELARATE